MECAPAYALSRCPHWQSFGTLTYGGNPPGLDRMRSDYFSLVRETAKWVGVHFQTLLWCLRIEQGSLGRDHMHYLLGHASREISYRLCMAQADWWCGKMVDGRPSHFGFAQVYPYDRQMNGVDYIVKSLSVAPQQSGGGDWLTPQRYEVSRFGLDRQELDFSHSLIHLLVRDSMEGRRDLLKLCGLRDRYRTESVGIGSTVVHIAQREQPRLISGADRRQNALAIGEPRLRETPVELSRAIRDRRIRLGIPVDGVTRVQNRKVSSELRSAVVGPAEEKRSGNTRDADNREIRPAMTERGDHWSTGIQAMFEDLTPRVEYPRPRRH